MFFKKSIYIIVIAFFFVYLFTYFTSISRGILYSPDEVRYFINTDFYKSIAALEFSSPLWQELDAYDQPPLGKYIFGMYVYSQHQDVDFVRSKLLSSNDRMSVENIQDIDIPGSIYEKYIISMRQVMFVVALILSFVMFCVFWILYKNIFLAIITVFFTVHHEYFFQPVLFAKPDSLFLLFYILSLVFGVYSFYKQQYIHTVFASVFLGLSILSKLTAVQLIVILPLVSLQLFVQKMISGRFMLFSALILFSGACIVWYLFNPTVYKKPIVSTKKYFSVRIYTLYSQQAELKGRDLALDSLRDKATALVCVVLKKSVGAYDCGENIPFFYIMCIFTTLGVIKLIQKPSSDNSFLEKVMLLLLGSIVVMNFIFIPIKWPRYYLLIVVSAGVLFGYGMQYAFENSVCYIKKCMKAVQSS